MVDNQCSSIIIYPWAHMSHVAMYSWSTDGRCGHIWSQENVELFNFVSCECPVPGLICAAVVAVATEVVAHAKLYPVLVNK
jgi:hypothetical protein